jgi:HD-GYP domain-containing protein (c-di-GMP phosphodiesterase class II)
MEALIQVMETTIATRDPYTVGHQQRVTRMACAIAQEMGISKDRVEQLRIAGRLHDLGKIAIPTGLLSKSGNLTPLEFALIQTHPQVAYNILKPITLPGDTAEIILQHHERLDGSGYPRGLKGTDILMEARILGVADVVEAMCSHRPYRPALGLSNALEEVSRHQGILYDPAVVQACIRLYGQNLEEPGPLPVDAPPQTPTISPPALPQNYAARLWEIPQETKDKPSLWGRLLHKEHGSWAQSGTVSLMAWLMMVSIRGM